MVRYCSIAQVEQVAEECSTFYGLPFTVQQDTVGPFRSHPYFVAPVRPFSPFVRRDDGNTPQVQP